MANLPKASPNKPRKLSDVPGWDFETDVAVVGFGGAGACAAIEAADGGADVIIFELASTSGGTTALSSGDIYMGGSGGTPIQKACGFEDSSEDMFNFMMMASGPLADEAKVRAYVDGSVDHFHWLVKTGVPYKESFHDERISYTLTDDCLLYTSNEKVWPFVEKAKPCPRGHNIQVEGDNGGPVLMNALTKQVENLGVRIVYEARALTLIVDEDRSVVGLVVRIDQQEKHVKVRKGIILCAGGFNMNEKMLKKYAPLLRRANEAIGNPGDTGTGIMMGMGVGAAAINMNEGFVCIPFYPPSSFTYGIFINSRGERFINEDCYQARVGHSCLHQDSKRIYLVISVEDYSHYEEFNILSADIAGTGETVSELEEELQIPEGQLQHTIEFYNKHAANGEDPLFHKSKEWVKPLKAPYVALDCTPGRGAIIAFFTLGGLDTLPTGEVLKPDGEVIPGLYAAGRNTCGVPRTSAGYGSGMSIGDATFFGRMAGKSAAAAPSRD
jgi:succinate dehydrogenase/fumarate reductase flavoprotein subunit